MRVAILASGRGSNFEQLLRAAREPSAGYEIALLGVDRACAAEEIARREGIPVYRALAREVGMANWEQGFLSAAEAHGVQALVLAGFLRVLSGAFVGHYEGRTLNVHPSLLPAFPGLDAIGQALRYGVRVTGVTVHLVDETLDGGPIVLQEALEVREDEGADTLAERIHKIEHRLLPEAVRLLAKARLRVLDRKVHIVEG